jgi:16S rRNA (cytidine1402-2'-O)-methyltransferase
MAQTLYLVATPIGNLEDMTYRGVRVLGEVDLIACEDTRQTRKLLDHYGIARPMVSYHEHNEAGRAADLVARLDSGQNIAIVTDAGTPLISDPGYRAVRAALEAGHRVVALPGASAILTALAASGLPTDAFRFCGFLPPKQGARRRALQQAAADPATLVFYEAPHRIVETLADVAEMLGSRPVVVARELTKLHEEFLRGTAAELKAILEARPAVKGEITLLIGKADTLAEAAAQEGTVVEAVAALEKEGLPRMDAIKQVARDRGLNKRDVYREVTGSEQER